MKYFSLSSRPVWLRFSYRYLPPLHSYFSFKISEVLSPTPFPVSFGGGTRGREQENLFFLKPLLCVTQFRSTNIGSLLCSWPRWGGTRVSWSCFGSPEAHEETVLPAVSRSQPRNAGCLGSAHVLCVCVVPSHLSTGEGWQNPWEKGWPVVLLWEKQSQTIPFGKPSLPCVSVDVFCRQSGMAACHLPVWITIELISFCSFLKIPDHLNASCEMLYGFDFQRCFFFGLCSAVVCWHSEMPPCCQDWFCSALWNIDIPSAGFCWC